MNRKERRAAARERAQHEGKVFHGGVAMTHLEKKARVIAGLYNSAQPLGMGVIHYVPGKMPVKEALALASEHATTSLDYHRGRVIKCRVDVFGQLDASSEYLYDRDNGEGACKRAVAWGLSDPYYDELAVLCSGADPHA